MQVDGKMHVDCWIQQVTTRVGGVTCWIQQSVSPKQVVGFSCLFNSEVDQLISKAIVASIWPCGQPDLSSFVSRKRCSTSCRCQKFGGQNGQRSEAIHEDRIWPFIIPSVAKINENSSAAAAAAAVGGGKDFGSAAARKKKIKIFTKNWEKQKIAKNIEKIDKNVDFGGATN